MMLALSLYSQQPVSAEEQPTAQQSFPRIGEETPPSNLNNEDEMMNWLISGDKTAEHMISLGIESKFAREWTSAAKENLGVYPNFKLLHIGTHRHAAVLFLPCVSFLQNAYLYLLESNDTAWKVIDNLELDCHYDNRVSIEIGQIRKPQWDEILIHHACGGHGTGYLEQNFSIYSVALKKFKQEMETDDLLHEYPAGGNPLELERNSTFTLIPVAGSLAKVIEETRSQVRNGKFTVQRRLFRWNSSHARYEPSPFTPVEAAAISK